MAQNNTSLPDDPITQLYEIANTLRMMHEKLGEVYPELKHTWYLLERSLNECLEVLDAAAVDAALKKGA
ncbi:hypothetical protein [Halodesulfovibrio spirochaetisodalis]|uniref:Uncharacterized protein n=1 Tax=Halodesulfovibrio spirochaetisodalis TaxID=1560234 RepID=A0A1B7XMX2_9BACT|nr:hypothetical protein [Halodesulfovibrio spirochaetisodalis]OBQ56863.1 hypothetical protein SP90_02045 [Halodesulfovibrio spirochaetisodalis]